MTRLFAVDENNDIYIAKNGRLAMADGLPAVLQNIEHAVKARLSEMVLAVDRGIPFFETIWNGSPNIGQYDAALRVAVLRVEGVLRIDSISFNRNGSSITYTMVVETIYGGVVSNGSI